MRSSNFLSLHTSGNPLLVGNFWNRQSVQILAEAGFSALGSSSAAIAADRGLEDGEVLAFSDALNVCVAAVEQFDGPVSMDFEAGYASILEDIMANAEHIYAAGIDGLNLEDSLKSSTGLRPIDKQCQIIEAVKHIQKTHVEGGVLNARIDTVLQGEKDLANTVERANAYIEAGADSVFIPGLLDVKLLALLCSEVSAPVNAMLLPGTKVSIKDLSNAGVARISFGNFFRDSIQESSVASAKRYLNGGNPSYIVD